MTTNQTIDGVPRATAERIHACLEAHRYAESTKLAKELRALLDAPAINHDQKASDHQFYTAQLQARAAKVLRLDPENTSWFEVVGEMEKAAAQAQGEPVAHLILGETFYGTNGPEVGDFDIQYDHEACERLAKAFPGQQVALYAEQPAPDNALKDFANDMITAAFEGGSFDGGDIQDIAVKHGLLRIEQREEECGEVCACRSEGDGFPAECYRKTALLRGEHPAPVAVTLQQVLTVYDYAESHPHKHLRGTTNWCAAVAYSLNSTRPTHANPPPGTEPSGTHHDNDGLDEWRKP